MGHTLILTDDTSRGERLARNLGGVQNLVVHDIYGDGHAPMGSALIISDVSALTSESIQRLRRTLGAARGVGTPFLFLIHGNLGRGEIQAAALSATRTLPASSATAMLVNAIAALNGAQATTVPGDLRRQVAEARSAFTAIFRADEVPAPSVVDAGTDIVNRAIRESKVRDWLDVVARFDDATHRHCLTVAGLAAAFAKTLGLNDFDSHNLTKGALLHDVGKSRIPLAILNKPGPLTPAERTEMDRHPALGHEMLRDGDYCSLMLSVVRSHHEYLDGSGYPDGLRADEISDTVRLVTICDIFGALIEARPYKRSNTAEQAYGILRTMGPKLDADLVRAFGAVATACEGPALMASA